MDNTQYKQEVERLLGKVMLGDRTAFNKLYNHSAAKLMTVIIRIVGQNKLSEDCLQESFVKIWRQAHTYRPDLGGAWAWMCQIARNHSIDKVRQIKRNSEVQIDEQVLETLSSSDTVWSDRLSLGKCLGQLKDRTREAIILSYIHGLSHGELAEKLGTPLGTLKSWVRRGLRELRLCLEA